MIVNLVRQLVDDKKLTPCDFARKAKIAKNTAYSLYLNPFHGFGKDVLDKVCGTFNVQPGDVQIYVDPASDEGKILLQKQEEINQSLSDVMNYSGLLD